MNECQKLSELKRVISPLLNTFLYICTKKKYAKDRYMIDNIIPMSGSIIDILPEDTIFRMPSKAYEGGIIFANGCRAAGRVEIG